jgi:tetratricopeptide (TPR) repeat protein
MARFNTVRQATIWFNGDVDTLTNPVEIYAYAVKFLLERSEIEKSILWLDKALAIKPDYYQAEIRKCEALRLCGKSFEAFDAGQRAINLINKYGAFADLNWCRIEFGLAALRKGQFDQFKELINAVVPDLENNQQSFGSGFTLTELIEMGKDQESALKILRDHDEYAFARARRMEEWIKYFSCLVGLAEWEADDLDPTGDDQDFDISNIITKQMMTMIKTGLGYGFFYGSRKNMIEEIADSLVNQEVGSVMGFFALFINSTQDWIELEPIPYF